MPSDEADGLQCLHRWADDLQLMLGMHQSDGVGRGSSPSPDPRYEDVRRSIAEAGRLRGEHPKPCRKHESRHP